MPEAELESFDGRLLYHAAVPSPTTALRKIGERYGGGARRGARTEPSSSACAKKSSRKLTRVKASRAEIRSYGNPKANKAIQFSGSFHRGPGVCSSLPNAWDVASARIFEDAGFPRDLRTNLRRVLLFFFAGLSRRPSAFRGRKCSARIGPHRSRPFMSL